MREFHNQSNHCRNFRCSREIQRTFTFDREMQRRTDIHFAQAKAATKWHPNTSTYNENFKLRMQSWQLFFALLFLKVSS
jgi:hypothetical protein